MTLAARCPACGTLFRVVADQLRVSEGWVRCGRCAEVFNAIETLVDLHAAAPPRHAARVIEDLARLAAPGDDETEVERTLAAGAGFEGADATRAEPGIDVELELPPAVPEAARPIEADGDHAPDAGFVELPLDPRPGPAARAAAGAPWDDDAGEPMATAVGTDADRRLDEEAGTPDTVLSFSPALDRARAAERDAGRSEPAAEPAFVRRAERAARWRRPGVRVALGFVLLLALVLLAAQLGYAYRDLAAARWPPARALLERGCAIAGCALAAPRAIEALAVDSSSLVRIEGSALYRLNVVLRNRATHEVAAPALDLSLTDTQGTLIARRMLGAAELGAARPELGGGAELPLVAMLEVRERPVAGYTIEIFYP